MKKLLLLLFSLLLSFNSYGEWTKITENGFNDSYYIDFNSIKDRSGNVVWWEMKDMTEAFNGMSSIQRYYKGDCNEYRTTTLSIISYTGRMGTGESETVGGGNTNLEDIVGWNYPSPDTIEYTHLSLACLIAEYSSQSNYEDVLSGLIAIFESTDWENE